MKFINKEFDPFMSLVSKEIDSDEYFITTQEWDRHAGFYWGRSVDGFETQEEAETWLKEQREIKKTEEACAIGDSIINIKSR
jgi:hypothetical protein